MASAPAARVPHWPSALEPIELESVSSHTRASVRLYASDGSVDAKARGMFEQLAATSGDDAHPLAVRVEQLVVKAAYHFNRARVILVSAWRPHAGRHSTGEAVDFKLVGVRPSLLAAYLRHLPRAGVGVYTHPRTQFVHLDVREPSYHWIDASPPGIKWHEAQLRDPSASARDASWTPDMDLPM
jgi:peptidase M15-like protein